MASELRLLLPEGFLFELVGFLLVKVPLGEYLSSTSPFKPLIFAVHVIVLVS